MNRRKFIASLMSLTLLGWLFAKKSHAINPLSNHFNGNVFFDPHGSDPKSPLDVLRWSFEGISNKQPWPSSVPVIQTKPPLKSDILRVTFIGHASWLYQINGINILIDPVYSERVSPVSFAGPRRVCQPGIAINDLPPIDYIIITHNHYDHMDLETIKALRGNAEIFTPLGNDLLIPDFKGKVMDWGDKITLKGGITLHCEPCRHWSARGLFDRNKALWACFVIEAGNQRILHIGDTGYGSGIHFKNLQEKFKSFTLAILPIGAYQPRWFMKDQHVNPAEAVQIYQDIKAKVALASHWGMFALADEGRETPRLELNTALMAAGLTQKHFRVLEVGEVFTA